MSMHCRNNANRSMLHLLSVLGLVLLLSLLTSCRHKIDYGQYPAPADSLINPSASSDTVKTHVKADTVNVKKIAPNLDLYKHTWTSNKI